MKVNSVTHDEMPSYTLEDRKNNMILKLRNFRVYGDAEIKIPFNSTTLINGPSGAGKTSIFEAFIWIAYNGIANPERFETKRCWGWLFLGDTIIYRQKDSVFVKVWRLNQPAGPGVGLNGTIEYLQDEAQAEINRVYGNMDVFIATSYLRQKEFSVFLGGTDAEKLNVIKTVALKGSEFDEIKKPIKARVALLQESYTGAKAQLDMATASINRFDHSNPDIVKYQVPENSEEVVKKVRELRDYMETSDRHLENLDRQLEVALNREVSANIFKQQVDSVKAKKSQIDVELGKISLVNIRTRIEQIDIKLAEFSTVSFDAEKLAKAQLFKMWSQERDRMKAKFIEIEKDLDIVANNIRRVFPDFPSYPMTDLSTALMMSSMVSATSSAPLPPKDEFNRNEAQATAVTKALEFISKTKAKIEEIRTALGDTATLLNQAGLKSVQEAKTVLGITEKDLTAAQEKEKSIRSELEKYRLSNKMKCPQCQTSLIVGEDGRHLDKCGDTTITVVSAPQAVAVAPAVPTPSESKPILSPVSLTPITPNPTTSATTTSATTTSATTTSATTTTITAAGLTPLSGPILGNYEPKPTGPTGIGAMLGQQPNPTTTSGTITTTTSGTTTTPTKSNSQPNLLAGLSSKPSNPAINTPVAPASTPTTNTAAPTTIPTPTSTAATTVPTTNNSTPMQIQFTHDDLAKAASTTASIVAKRDRIKAIIIACEEKLKLDYGDVKDINQALTVLPAFTKYVEYKLALDSLIGSLNDYNTRRPEEVKEKVIDTSEKQRLETEKLNLNNQVDYHVHLSKLMETEDVNLNHFTQKLSDTISQGGANSVEIKKQKYELQVYKAQLQSHIDQLMHLSSATDLMAQRVVLEKVMRERMEHAQMMERMYMAAQRLLNKTIEAERISLQSAVDEINVNLSHILKRLFTNIPISVELSTTKALKSKKNQVSQRFDIKIFYNNAEYGSAKQLSGGEKDRVSLAITLALGQKYGSPFLFLDETLSSLDAELKSEAVALLKEYCTNKTVVAVAHDETEGLYHNIIRTKARV